MLLGLNTLTSKRCKKHHQDQSHKQCHQESFPTRWPHHHSHQLRYLSSQPTVHRCHDTLTAAGPENTTVSSQLSLPVLPTNCHFTKQMQNSKISQQQFMYAIN